MKTSKSFYYWLLLFAFCFISYQQIADHIRPNDHGENLLVSYLLGVAPNFFPAIGIPALFVTLIPQLKLPYPWINQQKHIAANIISLIGLISWEFIQLFSTKLHFDLHDILWSIIGAGIFHILWMVSPQKFKEL